MEYRVGDSSELYRYVTDAFGKITGVLDSNGTHVIRYIYDGYGNVTTKQSWSEASGIPVSGFVNPLLYNGYYYDTETGFYYCNSRYYDPQNARWINIDSALYSGVTGCNLFAYCGNDPVNYADSMGTFAIAVATVAIGGNYLVGALATLFVGAYLIENPISYTPPASTQPSAPVAPIAPAISGALAGVIEATTKQPQSATKAEEKEVISSSSQNSGTTYYHVTTLKNAIEIMTAGVMIGSVWEGWHVYAWERIPNNYAIKNSGAHKGVIISFKTNELFVKDDGIKNLICQLFGPVVSVSPGPILVWDVKIVGVSK